MNLVTQNELVALLAGTETRGAKLASLLTRTTPKLLVKDRVTGEPNPHTQGVARYALRPVVLGANYEAAVNRQRVNEADNGPVDYFDAASLWNGKGIYHSPYTVQHKDTGRVYFAVKPAQKAAETTTGSVAVVHEDKWIDVATNAPVDPKTLTNLLPVIKKAQKQEVEADVLWRTIALDSVLEVHYGGVYTLVH
jgi:hypothetical protein